MYRVFHPQFSRPQATQQPQTPGLAMQLATAGVAACIADMITFPLDTTKVMDVLIVIVVTNVNQTIIYITIVVTKISSLSITNPTMSR